MTLDQRSPLERWREMTETWIPPAVPTPDELFYAALVEYHKPRQLEHDGVRLHGFVFHSPELAEVRNEIGIRRKVKIFYNELDIRSLVVEHPRSGAYIIAYNKIKNCPALSFEQASQAKLASKTDDDAAVNFHSLREEATEISKTRDRKTARQQRRDHKKMTELRSAVERSKQPPPGEAAQTGKDEAAADSRLPVPKPSTVPFRRE
jgi:hypothetical protein